MISHTTAKKTKKKEKKNEKERYITKIKSNLTFCREKKKNKI